MTKNVYECMFILDSNRYARDANAVAAEIPALVERCGGEVLASRLWTEQKLAYPIRGQRKGVYWLTYFRMEGSGVTDLNRACQLHDAVLRSLVVRVDPRLVDALVAHARGERGRSETAEAAPAPDAKASEDPSGGADASEGGEAPAGEGAEAPAGEGAEAPAGDVKASD